MARLHSAPELTARVADAPHVQEGQRSSTIERTTITSSVRAVKHVGARRSLIASLLMLTACGGGGDSPTPAPVAVPTPAPAPAPTPAPPPAGLIRVSPASPFAAGCNGTQTGTLVVNAEVEPTIAVNPLNANNLVGSWQQDRWSNGGSQGIVSARSFDGGATWTTHALPFSRCAGGTTANGGDFDRASNPWIAFSADGTVQQLALTFDGTVFGPGSDSAMVVARSTDGGATWGPTTTLIRSGAGFFNDKGEIATDPHDARFVYAVWDRLVATGGGPSTFARSVDIGVTWSAATSIFDPGVNSQTIGNVIVVLPDGSLVDLFTQIDFGSNGQQTSKLAVIRSTDHGVTWSAPIKVADFLSVGTKDPQTGAPIRDADILGEIAADASGNLVVVWQDARFSGGVRDAVALSRSTDGGLTWSTPVAVNGAPAAAAFLPFVNIRSDGVIGVLYYDFRDDTSDSTTLQTDLWLARSADAGRTWTETRLAGPFDIDRAPLVDAGFFLGDYQALASIAGRFVTLFTVTTTDATDRTDIETAPTALLARDANAVAARRPDAMDAATDDALRARVSDAVAAALAQRWPGSKAPGRPR